MGEVLYSNSHIVDVPVSVHVASAVPFDEMVRTDRLSGRGQVAVVICMSSMAAGGCKP